MSIGEFQKETVLEESIYMLSYALLAVFQLRFKIRCKKYFCVDFK